MRTTGPLLATSTARWSASVVFPAPPFRAITATVSMAGLREVDVSRDELNDSRSPGYCRYQFSIGHDRSFADRPVEVVRWAATRGIRPLTGMKVVAGKRFLPSSPQTARPARVGSNKETAWAWNEVRSRLTLAGGGRLPSLFFVLRDL